MKHRNAIVFFGGMALVAVGYVCWAARVFIVPPAVEIDSDVTAEGRKLAQKWMDENPGFFSIPFEWDYFAGELMNPYKSSISPIRVTHHYYFNTSSPFELVVCRKGCRQIVRFCYENSAWMEPTIH